MNCLIGSKWSLGLESQLVDIPYFTQNLNSLYMKLRVHDEVQAKIYTCISKVKAVIFSIENSLAVQSVNCTISDQTYDLVFELYQTSLALFLTPSSFGGMERGVVLQ